MADDGVPTWSNEEEEHDDEASFEVSSHPGVVHARPSQTTCRRINLGGVSGFAAGARVPGHHLPGGLPEGHARDARPERRVGIRYERAEEARVFALADVSRRRRGAPRSQTLAAASTAELSIPRVHSNSTRTAW